MIIQNFCMMGQCGCVYAGWNIIQGSPEWLQYLATNCASTRNKWWRISKETLFLVSMDMKQTNCMIDLKARWQMTADPFVEVNDVLAYNVVHKQDPLVWINPSALFGFQDCEVNIFLLFTFEEIDNGVWCIATMPSTWNGHNSSDDASFWGQDSVSNCSECILTGSFLQTRMSTKHAVSQKMCILFVFPAPFPGRPYILLKMASYPHLH